jgi:hypothetical protein
MVGTEFCRWFAVLIGAQKTGQVRSSEDIGEVVDSAVLKRRHISGYFLPSPNSSKKIILIYGLTRETKEKGELIHICQRRLLTS